MTTNVRAESATIYQFPARGRFAVTARDDESKTNLQSQRVARVSFGGGWYHDEAIEAERRS